MPIYDLFSKREKWNKGEVPDTYVYDNIPKALRVQILHIWGDSIGPPQSTGYATINDILCREYGQFTLVHIQLDHFQNLRQFFTGEKTISKVLDVIELSFHYIDTAVREDYGRFQQDASVIADIAIDELNGRFKEHGIGYEFTSGQLVRIDSQFVHAEVIKPVLLLLQGNRYKGANQEFLSAHEHYRHGKHKECLNDCLKAFESVLKTICGKRKWTTKPTDTAKTLIEICFSNGLLPDYLQSEFSALRTTLQSGTPTIRNKTSGHGQGVKPTTVPAYVARYALGMTATAILFLSECEEALP